MREKEIKKGGKDKSDIGGWLRYLGGGNQFVCTARSCHGEPNFLSRLELRALTGRDREENETRAHIRYGLKGC